MIATTDRLKSDLKVFGRDLAKVIQTGALLAEGFAFVSLVHTDSPLQRAASDAASVALVLLDRPCSLEAAAAVIERSGVAVFLLDGIAAPHIESTGAPVLAWNDVALLQAIVASVRAQASISRHTIG